LRCVNENRKKRKRLRWQAANRVATASTEHSYWLALLSCVYATHAMQAIAFEWKPGFSQFLP